MPKPREGREAAILGEVLSLGEAMPLGEPPRPPQGLAPCQGAAQIPLLGRSWSLESS